jgi:hypothetical protein
MSNNTLQNINGEMINQEGGVVPLLIGATMVSGSLMGDYTPAYLYTVFLIIIIIGVGIYQYTNNYDFPPMSSASSSMSCCGCLLATVFIMSSFGKGIGYGTCFLTLGVNMCCIISYIQSLDDPDYWKTSKDFFGITMFKGW